MTVEPVVERVPAERLTSGDFFADIDHQDLVYFLLNVGDADCQLILMPAEVDAAGEAYRRAIVVDVGRTGKLPPLIEDLRASPKDRVMLRRKPGQGTFPIVVGTHPHDDHLRGMPEFFERYGQEIGEYWDPGYYFTGPAYVDTMAALEDAGNWIQYAQPTSGLARFVGLVKVTVLSPGIGLRNRFDSYGVTPNNASISLRVEFPSSRVEQRDEERRYLKIRRPQALILGADAQTLSWAQVVLDFPELRAQDSPVANYLKMASGSYPLNATVFKVAHHGSKHGVNLELLELIDPDISLVSSVSGGGKYNFPHRVAIEAIREGLQATTSGQRREPDWELRRGLHYTSGVDSNAVDLGSIAIVLSPSGRKRHIWRFGDGSSQTVDLGNSRQFT
jgi:competence protein ComEC